MARITPSTLTGGYADITAMNANFVALAAEFEKCIYRDGEITNSWTADQDSNNKRLLNLPFADSDSEPVVKGQLSSLDTIADHGLLTGLADDDHPNYLLLITRPPTNGNPGDVLTTDGSDNLSWAPSAGGTNPTGVNVCGSITLGDVNVNANYGKMEVANNDVGAGGSINFVNFAVNDYAGRIYSASDDFMVFNTTGGFRFASDLAFKIESLAGAGTRTVVVDTNGFLSAP